MSYKSDYLDQAFVRQLVHTHNLRVERMGIDWQGLQASNWLDILDEDDDGVSVIPYQSDSWVAAQSTVVDQELNDLLASLL